MLELYRCQCREGYRTSADSHFRFRGSLLQIIAHQCRLIVESHIVFLSSTVLVLQRYAAASSGSMNLKGDSKTFRYSRSSHNIRLQLQHDLSTLTTHGRISIRACLISVIGKKGSDHPNPDFSGAPPFGSRFSSFVPHLHHVTPACGVPKV
jgi:hypothetical protein